MKKIRFMLLVTITICGLAFLNVNAKNIYYVNKNGIEMTQEQYGYLCQFYDKNTISIMDLEKFNKEMAYNYTLKNEEVKYIETEISYLNGTPIEVKENIITEEEYNSVNEEISLYYDCNTAKACHETTYKKLYMQEYSSKNNVRMTLVNEWKKIPTVKSYDVIAMRFENFRLDAGEAYQYYNVGNTSKTISYDIKNGKNTIRKYLEGVGVSMNIPDDVTSKLSQKLIIDGVRYDLSKKTVSFYGTYQHANRSITLAQSQNYSFSSSGLGGVLKYNAGSSYFDAMKGINLTIIWAGEL